MEMAEGVIVLNGGALDADRTFTDEIQTVIGEGIDNLHFYGETITSTSGVVLQFTFVNGEKEFHDFIYYLHITYCFSRDFNHHKFYS